MQYTFLTTTAIMYNDFVWQLLFERSMAHQTTKAHVVWNQGGHAIGKMAEMDNIELLLI